MPQDSPKQIMRKLIDRAVTSFESTYDTIQQELQESVGLLLKADKILVVGVGQSSTRARDLAMRMMWVGLPVISENDSLLEGIIVHQLKENDVVFAISNSGRTKEVLLLAETASNVGAKVICLTSHVSSPLAQLSDEAITYLDKIAEVYEQHREAVRESSAGLRGKSDG